MQKNKLGPGVRFGSTKMSTPHVILLLNALSTWFMVGLIWLIQWVHYPLFASVGDELYPNYQRLHEQFITIVVFPPMVVELVTAIMLLSYRPEGINRYLVGVGLALVITIWISTAFLQVPCHAKLGEGFHAETHRYLVNSNWIRTIAWSLRGILSGWFIWQLIQPLPSGTP